MTKSKMSLSEIVSCEAIFKKNEEYDFTFEGVCEYNGEAYMRLSYGNERAVTIRGLENSGFVFRAKLFPFQQEVDQKYLCGKVRCYVRSFTPDDEGNLTDMPILYQCKGPILAKHYEVGKTYPFRVFDCPGTVLKNGKVTKWYTLVDFMNFTHRYWSFETLRQGDNVRATVDRFEEDALRFRDHDERPLSALYKEGVEYDFAVIGDEASKKAGYRQLLLRSPRPEDSFLEHRFLYPEACPTGKVAGDTIRLRCTGISKHGWLHLEYEGKGLSGEELKRLSEVGRAELADDVVPTEYVSSFAFSYGESSPDIDKKLGCDVMMRIAALANTDGGRIVVGVNSNLTYRGIAQDLPYLNAASEMPEVYPQTLEGLKKKVMDVVLSKLGGRAEKLVSVDFRKVESEKVICEIRVDKSMWPIYVDQKALYVRNGNLRQRLLGDEITRHILARLADFAGSFGASMNDVSL